MSTPDYEQFAEDHQCLLVVIKPIGPQMHPKLFNQIYDRLTQLYELKISSSKLVGTERIIRLRYKQSHSIENNDWGDFQAHRRLAGLITIARSFNENEIESITELHKTIHDTYANTLFDSRCFIIKSCENDNNEEESTNGPVFNENEPLSEEDEDVFEEKPELSGRVGENDIRSNDSFSNVREIPLPSEDQLLELHLGGQMFLSSASDHTSFTSRVNRSSSSSSLSSQNSHPASLTSSPLKQMSIPDDELQMNSLPPLHNHHQSTVGHVKTHSRNKSLDSRLMLPSDSSRLSGISKRPHSSSSSLLTVASRESLQSSFAGTSIEFLYYASDEQCSDQIELRTRDFLQGLFWALESRRVEKERAKKEKLPLLMAPCEKKDLVGLDTDTSKFRRKCLGRMIKHTADLNLMAGLAEESLYNYINAIENLKAVNDKLWLAAAYEGLCAASLILLFPKRWYLIQNLRHQLPYANGIVNDIVTRSDYEVARTEVGDLMKHIAKQDGKVDENIFGNKALMKNILTVDNFYDRYKEAASNYALYRGAAVLEFECSFKAARTLIFFKKYLKASDFIQNAVFITTNQPIDDQIERLLRISQLYETIHFYRKAAFYKRFAALKTVSLQLKTLDWDKCYFLLLPALYGYGLILDPTEYDRRLVSNTIPWSGIHVQLLQETITTSLKMQNEPLAMRHLSFMLQCLFNHISPSQRQEFATKLSSLAAKYGEGSPVPLRLTNGATIPSVNVTKFPIVNYFKMEPLKLYLRPYRLKYNLSIEEEKEAKNSGPFIYTPLQLNRSPAKTSSASKSVFKVKFYWVEGHTGSITLHLHNYLTIDLNISSITVMTDGVAFQPKHDTSLKMAPEASYVDISLTGIPLASGMLEILGYRIHALGIKSDCYLANLPNAKRLKLPAKFAVEVVPRLPLMCASSLTQQLTDDVRLERGLASNCDTFSDVYISGFTFISLFAGESKSFKVKLTNISPQSDQLIEMVNLEVLHAKSTNDHLRSLLKVHWNSDSIHDLLPIGRDLSLEFELNFTLQGDFVYQKKETSANKSKSLNSSVVPTLAAPPKKLQVLGSKKLANLINEFQARKSSTSEVVLPSIDVKSTSDPFEVEFEEEIFESKTIELCLQFEYSGGPGLISGFCRRVSLYFAVELKPSILITHWDVIPADQNNECYLVFDALNATAQEMNLIYAQNKEILIEPREKCRIPVPVQRCPLTLGDSFEEVPSDLSTVGKLACQVASEELPSGDDFLGYIFPTEQKLQAILEQCRHHLLKQIDLRWCQLATEVSGVALVDRVPYTSKMLKSLLIPPIHSEIEIDSNLIRTCFGEVTVRLGDSMTIEVRLFNSSHTTLHQLRLYLVYYQDYQNTQLNLSRVDGSLEGKMIITGCDSLCLPQLSTKETYMHKFGLIFLYTGIYRVDICCLPEERYQKLSQQQGLLETGSNNTQSSSQQQSLFKCLHTIEVTVEE